MNLAKPTSKRSEWEGYHRALLERARKQLEQMQKQENGFFLPNGRYGLYGELWQEYDLLESTPEQK